jgi:hypothetical protein
VLTRQLAPVWPSLTPEATRSTGGYRPESAAEQTGSDSLLAEASFDARIVTLPYSYGHSIFAEGELDDPNDRRRSP